MDRDTLQAEIPYNVAYAAHSGTSFVPEKRALSEQADYANSLLAIYAKLEKHAAQSGTQAVLTEAWP